MQPNRDDELNYLSVIVHYNWVPQKSRNTRLTPFICQPKKNEFGQKYSSHSVVCDAWYYSKSSTFLIAYNLKYPSLISNYFLNAKLLNTQ